MQLLRLQHGHALARQVSDSQLAPGFGLGGVRVGRRRVQDVFDPLLRLGASIPGRWRRF